jgi:hypothetical protein
VLDPTTSLHMRDLMKLNVAKGSGRRAEVEGFHVGGKTGTAEKVVNGRYSSAVRFNAFLSAFPIDNPRICGAGGDRRTQAGGGQAVRNRGSQRCADGGRHHPPFGRLSRRQTAFRKWRAGAVLVILTPQAAGRASPAAMQTKDLSIL